MIDLQLRPLMAPALVSADGTIMQGPNRDTFDFIGASFGSGADSNSGMMRTLKEATYRGNFLTDAQAAMWMLSNTRV